LELFEIGKRHFSPWRKASLENLEKGVSRERERERRGNPTVEKASEFVSNIPFARKVLRSREYTVQSWNRTQSVLL
jgi:hypothetical protein